MKNLGSHSWLSLFIFLIAGGILGGIVGEALYACLLYTSDAADEL